MLALGLAAACAATSVVGDGKARLTTVEILAPIGLLALALAQLAGAGRLRLRTLHHRFQLGVALALAQLLAAVAIGAAVMFVSAHDAWMTVAIVLFAGVIATRAAQLLLDGVVEDVNAVRRGLHEVQRGQRSVRITASSSRELEDLAESANRMTGALAVEEHARDVADAARRQVIAAVSHDLRTPLSTIQVLAEALRDGVVGGGEERRYLDTLNANVATLGTLIDDLFELACLDAGEIGWSTESVDLKTLVGETCLLVRPAAEQAGVRLLADLPAGLAQAQANGEQLRRVLMNLLQNAIRHTPSDGSVTIAASVLDGDVQLEVIDTGPGIAAADQPHVFDAFYRGGDDAARTRPGGGLGLAISRAIVEAHGGRIWLAEATNGTRVRFTLPTA